MPAHVACTPAGGPASDLEEGCFVVCRDHDFRYSFGFEHAVADAARREHNALHHPAADAAELLSIVYESRAAIDVGAADLQALLAEARTRNRAFGVTGMLLSEDGWFLQAIEGPPALVENLMAMIRDDPRHHHLRELSRETRRTRRFPDWAMAHGHITEIAAHPLAHYFEALLTVRGRRLAA